MSKLDFIIYPTIALTAPIIYFSNQYGQLGVGLSIISIIYGFVIYCFSVKSDKRSMVITMALLDKRKRIILEFLEEPKSMDEIVNKFSMPRSIVNDIIIFLKEKGFVSEERINNKSTYKRKF